MTDERPRRAQYASSLDVSDTSGTSLSAVLSFDDEGPITFSITPRITMAPPSVGVRALFAALCATFFGQLSMARKITIRGPELPAGAACWLEEIRRDLYAVRSYRDGRVTPAYGAFEPQPSKSDPSHARSRTGQTAVLLLSGGLDSALSALLLQANGYRVVPLHVRGVNGDASTSSSEEQAASLVASVLGLDLSVFDVASDTPLEELASRWTAVPTSFPVINPVPHGRELLLMSAAAWMLDGAHDASAVVFGIENSAWSDLFMLDGHLYPRSDTQSERGMTALQRISSYCLPGRATLFSPVAGMTEYRKCVELAERRSDLLRICSFCFWGTRCGLCQKCSLYYVIYRSLGVDAGPFLSNPLADPTEHLLRALRRPLDPQFRERQLALIDIQHAQAWRDDELSLALQVRSAQADLLADRESWRTDLLRLRYNVLLPDTFSLEQRVV